MRGRKRELLSLKPLSDHVPVAPLQKEASQSQPPSDLRIQPPVAFISRPTYGLYLHLPTTTSGEIRRGAILYLWPSALFLAVPFSLKLPLREESYRIIIPKMGEQERNGRIVPH